MIRTERDGGLVILTLDRPDKANALTSGMLATLADAVEAASTDQTVHALVLTGAGKVFSAGADLEAVGSGLATDPVWERLSGALAACPVLTIAALNGTVAGGAMGMVLATDIRLAVSTAKVFYPVMSLGFLPQPSDPARLAALVGPARARLILMTGAKITADEALTFGLVDRLADDVLTAARDAAAPALAADRSHVTALKAVT